MNRAQSDRQKIQILQVLRAVAALVVFLSHYFSEGYTLYGVTFTGRVGVGVFFVISGFLLIYTDKANYKGYIIKRLIRICPLYWLTTLLVFALGLFAPSLLHTSVSTIPNLLKSLCFIPYYSAQGIYPLHTVGWTLIIEMFVYLLYFIAVHMARWIGRIKPVFNKTNSVIGNRVGDFARISEQGEGANRLHNPSASLLKPCVELRGGGYNYFDCPSSTYFIKPKRAERDEKLIFVYLWRQLYDLLYHRDHRRHAHDNIPRAV